MENKITINDIIKYIIENYDNKEEMDKINSITFPFTSKYNNWNNKKEEQKINNKNDKDEKNEPYEEPYEEWNK